jgi:hypothetical protein
MDQRNDHSGAHRETSKTSSGWQFANSRYAIGSELPRTCFLETVWEVPMGTKPGLYRPAKRGEKAVFACWGRTI